MDLVDLFAVLEQDDEDMQNDLEVINHRIRQVPERPNHFTIWNDQEFYCRFRLSKLTVNRILHEIEGRISNPTNRNHALSPAVMVLLTLRFFATGSFLITVDDFGGIHKSTASKVIHSVSCNCTTKSSIYKNAYHCPRNCKSSTGIL